MALSCCLHTIVPCFASGGYNDTEQPLPPMDGEEKWHRRGTEVLSLWQTALGARPQRWQETQLHPETLQPLLPYSPNPYSPMAGGSSNPSQGWGATGDGNSPPSVQHTASGYLVS